MRSKNIFNPTIVVANILPNSYFQLSENINQSNIIVKINSIEVSTIDDIRNLLKNLTSDIRFLTFETDKNIIDTICIDTIRSDIDLIIK
jgi:hypothetical protein